MPDEPEVILQQMEETRSSLTEKLETLEKQVVDTVADSTTAVRDTVSNVKDAVRETVDTVKESVQETVETVKSTFDLASHAERYPWLFMGGAVTAGFVAGYCLLPASQRSTLDGTRGFGPADRTREFEAAHRPASPVSYGSSQSSATGWLSGWTQQFAEEIDKVKSMALGVVLGLARDAVVKSVPEQLRPRVNEVANGITMKLGAEVY